MEEIHFKIRAEKLGGKLQLWDIKESGSSGGFVYACDGIQDDRDFPCPPPSRAPAATPPRRRLTGLSCPLWSPPHADVASQGWVRSKVSTYFVPGRSYLSSNPFFNYYQTWKFEVKVFPEGDLGRSRLRGCEGFTASVFFESFWFCAQWNRRLF